MEKTNDLISRAELQETVECHVTTVSVCATAEEARGRTAMKNICLEDIAAAPAVDAIPVEWLEEQAKDNYDYSGTLIRGLLSEWQKEQEVR